MKRYADRVNADYKALGPTSTPQPWWGLEKFRVGLPAHIRGYDQILYVDADVIIQEDAPDIFDLHESGKVLISDDLPCVIEQNNTGWTQPDLDRMLNSQIGHSIEVKRCLNSGVILFDQSTADIWTPPPKPFTPSHCAEQWWIDYQIGDRWTNLPLEFNYQWWFTGFNEHWKNNHFVHLSAMGLQNKCPMSWYYRNILKREPPGSLLKAIFKSYGAKPCKNCKITADKMDRMGSQWCREKADDLIAEIHANINKFPWYKRAAAKGYLALRRIHIEESFWQAVDGTWRADK
jgi:hypothetical protein